MARRPPASDPLLGRVLAEKYELCALVGKGGMARIYRARHVRTEKELAVKVLHGKLAEDRRMLRRFQDEALLAGCLSHPNIVTIVDHGKTGDGIHYLVMEFLLGRPLGQVVAQQAPIPFVRARRIMHQLLAALDESHRAGVVHGDVKSDNVMIGEADAVKLLDFGLARSVGSSARRTGGGICGTPEYVAPEVLRGEPPGIPADLYGAGVVLYELLTGLLPFGGDSALEVMDRQLNGAVVPPSLRCPERRIPAQLDALVVRTLAKDPDARPASAEELRVALDRLLAGADDRSVRGRERLDTGQHLDVGSSTKNWLGAVHVRAPAPNRPHDDAGIRAALRRGDLELASTLYVDDVTELVRSRETTRALSVIEQGLEDLGHARVVPSGVWRLLLLRARIHAAAGRAAEAMDAARSALRFADHCGLSHRSRQWHMLEELNGGVDLR